MLELQLYKLLRENLVMVDGVGQQALAPFGLNVAQYDVLRILALEDGLRMGELGIRLLVDNSKMTRIADRLVSRQLIERRHDAVDRRSWRLHITPAGRVLLTDAATIHNQFLTAQFAIFDEGEKQQLLTLLTRLRQQLRSN